MVIAKSRRVKASKGKGSTDLRADGPNQQSSQTGKKKDNTSNLKKRKPELRGRYNFLDTSTKASVITSKATTRAIGAIGVSKPRGEQKRKQGA
jgi:hypothetical protein